MGGVLKVLIALGALCMLALVGFFFTPLGRALVHAAVGMSRAATSPAAQEMKRNGCDTAVVANLRETLGALGESLGKKGAAPPPDLTAVLCQVRSSQKPPSCETLAIAYGRMDEAPEKFSVAVRTDGNVITCEGIFDRSGQRLDAPAPGAPAGGTAPATP